MDLFEILLVAVRRWYVSVPAVLVAILTAVAVGFVMQPEYKASATVLLIPPTVNPNDRRPTPASATPVERNPWLSLGEVGMAQAVQVSLTAPQARQRVEAAGGVPDYEVGHTVRTGLLTIDVAAPTPEQVAVTVDTVTALIAEEVVERQRDYDPGPGEAIGTQLLDSGAGVVTSRFHILRTQLIVGAVGMVLATVFVVSFHAIARRPSRSRREQLASASRSGTGSVGVASVGASRIDPASPEAARVDRDVRPARPGNGRATGAASVGRAGSVGVAKVVGPAPPSASAPPPAPATWPPAPPGGRG
ncbi:Wzz/FepE/Etk N-terminal domain-containing protein [Polymorphospora sp. NPDC050346]|uniref:Wzz/FepE/Etk N-terminal domain-containing protein n=1 Tax=Polymorphospora sp. NPDC050346 TaxID=3155780 RepID=UPI0033BFED17